MVRARTDDTFIERGVTARHHRLSSVICTAGWLALVNDLPPYKSAIEAGERIRHVREFVGRDWSVWRTCTSNKQRQATSHVTEPRAASDAKN